MDSFSESFAPKKNMAKFAALLQNSAKSLLSKEVDIWFYDKADGTIAHAKQGQGNQKPIVAFNLKGPVLKKFFAMLDSSEPAWDHELYLSALATLTHELVHTQERSGQISHDEAFFTAQEKLLQRLFIISDEDISMWTKDLWL